MTVGVGLYSCFLLGLTRALQICANAPGGTVNSPGLEAAGARGLGTGHVFCFAQPSAWCGRGHKPAGAIGMTTYEVMVRYGESCGASEPS